MKYYESCFEEYLNSIEQINLHPELNDVIASMPKNIDNIENMMIYGAPGIGKYSQCLKILKQYSPSGLKYDKQITATTDKQRYTYRISDIHYEIDMSMLGCNSKTLWYEIFFQIVDIVSVSSKKMGIIVCKNFHSIHSELLDIFYSYMQHYNHNLSNIKIKFILITENIGFIPTNIINTCSVINIQRPSVELYKLVANKFTHNNLKGSTPSDFIHRISNITKSNNSIISNPMSSDLFENIAASDITNIKEIRSFDLTHTQNDSLPTDLFNVVCDKIIRDTYNIHTIDYTDYRDSLYNMLTYNLDVAECIWYILSHFIENDHLEYTAISEILEETYSFFKYYNNNYRPIYHLESIMFYIIKRLDISK
jgi:hypothetical protein